MNSNSINRLHYLCDSIPGLLSAIPNDKFSYKPSPDKWSKKEILGHLIDSATNNHQRFVRSQFEIIPAISYNQNKWNECSYYDQMEVRLLIDFWALYNRHLLELFKCIPPHKLLSECNSGEKNPVTIQWLFDDYVKHLEHHLKQIVEYI